MLKKIIKVIIVVIIVFSISYVTAYVALKTLGYGEIKNTQEAVIEVLGASGIIEQDEKGEVIINKVVRLRDIATE